MWSLLDENSELKSELEEAHNDIYTHKLKIDALVFEEENQKSGIERLNNKIKELNTCNNDLTKREFKLQQELKEKQTLLDDKTQLEKQLDIANKELKCSLNKERSSNSTLTLKIEQLNARIENQENEILMHVKTKSESEQEIMLNYNTMETLRKSHDASEEKRLNIQLNLEEAIEKVDIMENSLSAVKENEQELKSANENLQAELDSLQSEKSMLQTDMNILQVKLCESQNLIEEMVSKKEYEEIKSKLNNANKELEMLKYTQFKNKYAGNNKKNILTTEMKSKSDEIPVAYELSKKLTSELKAVSMKNNLNQDECLSEHNSSCEIESANENNELKTLTNYCDRKSSFYDDDDNSSIYKLNYDLTAKLEEKENHIYNLNEELAKKEEFINELAEELTRKETFVNELQDKNNKYSDSFEAERILKEKKLSELEKEIEQNKNTIRELKNFNIELQDSNKIDSNSKKTVKFDKIFDKCDKQNEDELLKNKLVEKEIKLSDIQILCNKQRDTIVEKNTELSDLEIHCNRLRDIVDSQQEDIERLFNQIDLFRKTSKERDNQKPNENEINVNTAVGTFKLQNCSHIRNPVENTEGVTTNSFILPEKSDSSDQVSKNSSFDILSDTREELDVIAHLRLQNKGLKGELELVKAQLQRQNNYQAKALKDICACESDLPSIQRDTTVTKEEYTEILEILDQKNNIIEELQLRLSNHNYESVQLSFVDAKSSSSSDEIIMGRKTKAPLPGLVDLKLPQPGFRSENIEGRPRNRTTSLPTTPIPSKSHASNLNTSQPVTDKFKVKLNAKSPYKNIQSFNIIKDSKGRPASSLQISSDRPLSSQRILNERQSSSQRISNEKLPYSSQRNVNEKVKLEVEKKELEFKFQNEIRINKDQKLNAESEIGDLRSKLFRFDNDLLNKQIEVDKIKEELADVRRKKDRIEESYNKILTKNEVLENEILENKRKIREYQARRNAGEVTESHYKRELSKLNSSAESLSEQCNRLIKKRDELENNLKQQEKGREEMKLSYSESQREVEYWKHNFDILQKECQELSSSNEQFQKIIDELKNDIKNTEKMLDDTKSQVNIWKEKSKLCDEQKNKLLIEKRSLQNELIEKSEVCEDFKVKLLDKEKDKNAQDVQISENSRLINDLRLNIMDLEEEKRNVESQKVKLEILLQGNTETQKELLNEKDLVENNLRYMQHKIDELNEVVSQKENIIFRHQERDSEISNQLKELNTQFKAKNLELKHAATSLEREVKNTERLDKLNNDMNNENKRLMSEMMSLKEKLQGTDHENNLYKDRMNKLEREQNHLDNMIIKTQKSNSELMTDNQSVNDELRLLKNKIALLEHEHQTTAKEKQDLELKVKTWNETFNEMTNKLTGENRDLLEELQGTRQSMGEFESILDQGQEDFNELEAQLEVYRLENIELDEKLHNVLKEHIRLQSECEDLKRNFENQNKELNRVIQERDETKEFNIRLQNQHQTLEMQYNESKNREEYFEERLKGFENVVKSKEETLFCEKKEKDTLQLDMLKVQKELIESRNRNESLRSDIGFKNEEFTDLKLKLENVYGELLATRQEKLNVEENAGSFRIQLDDTQSSILKLKTDREELEMKYGESLKSLHELEAKFEEEQATHTIEKEELLTELSILKRNANETNKQKMQELEVALSQMDESNQILKMNENEWEKERQALVQSSESCKERANRIEMEMTQEILQLRNTVEAMENSRKNDFCHTQAQLKENEDLRRQLDEDKRNKTHTEMDIESMKYDITQLQDVVNSLEARNEELQNENEKLKDFLVEIETKKVELEGEKVQLMEDINQKEDDLKELQNQKGLTEREKQTISSQHNQLESDIEILKKQLRDYEELKVENESLKYDLEAILDERLLMQAQLKEQSVIRSDNFDLRTRVERITTVENENRLLKQDLKEREVRYRGTLEKLNNENTVLRRNVDELFKKNQDLELRHVGYVRARPMSSIYNEQSTPPVIRPSKAVSYDNISDIGFDNDFVPIKHATSTPTPGKNEKQVIPLKRVEFMKARDNLDYDDNATEEGSKVVKKIDASYGEKTEEKLTLDIKSNPFLKRDKSNVNTPTPKSPTKNLYSWKIAASAFDMRPQSVNNIPQQQVIAPRTPTKSQSIGNEFVNRLKAAFEKK